MKIVGIRFGVGENAPTVSEVCVTLRLADAEGETIALTVPLDEVRSNVRFEPVRRCADGSPVSASDGGKLFWCRIDDSQGPDDKA